MCNAARKHLNAVYPLSLLVLLNDCYPVASAFFLSVISLMI
jgi:hypothetical protein